MSTILVVDDDAADRDLIVQTVTRQGHTALPAATAAEGWKLAQQGRADTAVLDVLLPDGDGIDLFRKIRSIDNTLPVIFVTASGSSNTAIEAMQLGALDYLVKPLRVAEVRTLVDRALEVRRLAVEPMVLDPAPAQARRRVTAT